jgi:hypothetical protein
MNVDQLLGELLGKGSMTKKSTAGQAYIYM